jgi:DMSO/TMAO reductase YedYZ molybdopterin-dependent catalytic subunit
MAGRAHRIGLLAAAGVLAAVGLVALVAACSSSGGSSGPGKPAASSSGKVVLTVVGPKGTRELTLAELKAMPAVVGYGGIKNSAGIITPPTQYQGVKLSDVADLVGGIDPQAGVTLVGSDGYGMTFSYDQIVRNGFTTYDVATGAEEPPDGTLTSILAYAQGGKPLGADDGPLRLAVVQPHADQVIDGHWTVKWVARVVVGKAEAAWNVQLQGVQAAKLDRPSYVNCASPGCHGSGWVDPQGRRWEGIPLYLVCGLLDDHKRHGAGDYDAALAKRGYKILIESADGTVVTIPSQLIAGRDDIILSGKMNGSDLPDAYFPLRLVGPGLTQQQMPGRIARIVLRLP